MPLFAALTLWDYVLALGGALLAMYAFMFIMVRGGRLLLFVAWKLMPNGRIKRALFKERGTPDHSMINPNDPWVQAQWVKRPQGRTNRIHAPPEFIPGERADPARSGTDQQGPASRR